jgi:hypothetical protein
LPAVFLPPVTFESSSRSVSTSPASAAQPVGGFESFKWPDIEDPKESRNAAAPSASEVPASLRSPMASEAQDKPLSAAMEKSAGELDTALTSPSIRPSEAPSPVDRRRPWPLLATFLSGAAVAGVLALLWVNGQRFANDREVSAVHQGLQTVQAHQKDVDTRIQQLSERTVKMDEQTNARVDKVSVEVDRQGKQQEQAQATVVKMAKELLSIRDAVVKAQKRMDRRVDQIEEGMIEREVSSQPGRRRPMISRVTAASSEVLTK